MTVYSFHQFFWSDVHRKIFLANQMNDLFGSTLSSSIEVGEHLEKLSDRQKSVCLCMQELKLPDLCGECSRTSPTGGCCSQAMAGENDAVLLLINLLAGVRVYMHRDDGRECYFLGPGGCTLRYKPLFCLNYLCARIRKTVSGELLGRLETVTGLLLQEQYALEQKLLRTLRTNNYLA